MNARRLSIMGLVTAFGAGACTEPATGLVVWVDSDLEVPGVLRQVEVDVQLPGQAPSSAVFDIAVDPNAPCTNTTCPLPLSVGVAPGTDGAQGFAQVTVRGVGASGVVVARSAQTGFVQGKTLALPIFLAETCRGISCESGQTCVGGACESEIVDPTTLDEIPDGTLPRGAFPRPRPDAATQVADAGVGRDAENPADARVSPDASAGRDAAPRDAGSRPDARPPSDSGVHPDARVEPDAAVPPDAGVTPDAGAPPIMLDWVRSTVASIPNLEFTRAEITVDEYEACVMAGACAMDTFLPFSRSRRCVFGAPNKSGYPMNCMLWFGADAFCRWAGGRLPTASEWTAEASNDGMRVFAWGSMPDPSCSHAVVKENGVYGCGRDEPWPGCSKRMGDSVSGLCDMTGNLNEWTSTMIGSTSYVTKGGDFWNDVPSYFRVTNSSGTGPTNNSSTLGVRCVRDVP